MAPDPVPGGRRAELGALAASVRADLDAAHAAREVAVPASREVIRATGRAIRATHLGEHDRASELTTEAEAALRRAQAAVADHPRVAHSGPLHDAEKEFAEARLTAALLGGSPLPGPADVGVEPAAWLRGLAEAATELRRSLLDAMRSGDLARGEELLEVMDEIYEVLFAIDYPDAITSGLRRNVDALRAVLERTRGDVTTTVLQDRLRRSLDAVVDEID
ncbi:MAG TPA: hypothetical protein VGA13_03980 [Acidimicrobiales bacterium]